jgi:hypothetical protein
VGELVSFAMGFWKQEEIEAALGAKLAAAIPELLRLCDLEVRIPRIEVVALERVAARDGKSVDAVVVRGDPRVRGGPGLAGVMRPRSLTPPKHGGSAQRSCALRMEIRAGGEVGFPARSS